MNRIAIFGGTFNPIHNGHLHIAQQFEKQLHVQRLLFIPTFVPPHKQISDLAPAEDRLEMCRLACLGTSYEDVYKRQTPTGVWTLTAIQ